MTSGAGELSVQTRLHQRNRWILVPLFLSDGSELEFVLDTGSPLSGISGPTRELLAERGLLAPAALRRFLLRDVTIDHQPIADLIVRESRRVTEAGAQGILGLDFLQRFTEVSFHVPTLRLTLRY